LNLSIQQIDIPEKKIKKVQTKKSRDQKKQLKFDKEELHSFQNMEKKYSIHKKIIKIMFEILSTLLKLTYRNDPLFISTLRLLSRHSHLIKLEFILNMVQILSKLIKSLPYEEMLNTCFCCFSILSKRPKILEYELKIVQQCFYDRIWEVLLSENGNTFNVFLAILKFLFKTKNIGKHLVIFLKRFLIISINLKTEFNEKLLEIIAKTLNQHPNWMNLLIDEIEMKNIYSSGDKNINICYKIETVAWELSLLQFSYAPQIRKKAKKLMDNNLC